MKEQFICSFLCFFNSTSEGTVVGAGDSGVNRTGEVFVLLEIQNQVNK